MDSADPILESAIKKILADVARQLKELGEAVVPADDVWFRNLLFALMKSTLMDYRHVQNASSVPLIAWGRRNLLELRVITDFVLASEANARSFQTDLLIDAKEFHEALSKHHASLHKRLVEEATAHAETLSGQTRETVQQWVEAKAAQAADTTGPDSEVDMFKSLLDEMGVKDKRKPLMSSKIAELIGQSNNFNPEFKICSKLMHRTALSIAAENQQHSLDEVMPSLKDAAFTDLASISYKIKQYIDTLGIRPRSGTIS